MHNSLSDNQKKFMIILIRENQFWQSFIKLFIHVALIKVLPFYASNRGNSS